MLDGKRFDLFLKTFFQTIVREWGLIDRYRLDKYMFLIRFMLREALTQLKQWKWPKLRTATYVAAAALSLLMRGVAWLHPFLLCCGIADWAVH